MGAAAYDGCNDRGKGFTHAAVVRFRTRDDLKTYMVHAAHLAFVKQFVVPAIADMAQDVCVIDYSAEPLKSQCPPAYKYGLPAVVAALSVAAAWWVGRHGATASKK